MTTTPEQTRGSGLIDVSRASLRELMDANGQSALDEAIRRVTETAEGASVEQVCAFNSAI